MLLVIKKTLVITTNLTKTESASECAHSWPGFGDGVLQVVLFTVLWFKWSVKKCCIAKVLLAIWEIFLNENNCNYNSYRFSYKFAFILFLSFLIKLKAKFRFSANWWSGNEKYFFFCLKRVVLYSKPCRIQ